jgi:glycosyltransferase involved in cell wall biosynthesis
MIDSTVTREMKIISVITPSYNQGLFIEETIQSVLMQTGNFFIDYIIMDGGSTDRTAEIIKNYEDLLTRNCKLLENDGLKYYVKMNQDFPWNNCLGISYRWKSEKDKGQVDALKKGFSLAKGHIYCWLNSDDIYLNNNVYQKVSDYFDQSPELQLLTADGTFITKDGEKIGIHHVEHIQFKELLYLDYHILQPSTFFHKDIYNENNLNEKYICAFDADFFIHMLFDGVTYKKVNDRLGAFRFYHDNKTLGLSKKRWVEQRKIAWSYSKNIFYLLISIIYRYYEIVLKPRYSGKRKTFDRFFILLKKISYKIITGKPGR